MVKNFIIPVDISDLSQKSLEYALLFDKIVPINIHIIGCGYEDDAVEQKLAALLEKYRNKFSPETTIKTSTSIGKFHEEIGGISNSVEDPLIIISSHKDLQNRDFFSIQDVLKIVDASKQHVINLPETDFPFKIEKIAYPVHTTSRVRHKATFTARLAKFFQAGVDIVSTQATSKEKLIKMCRLYCQQIANHYQSIDIPLAINSVTGTNLASLVADYARQSNADIISMIPEDKKDMRFFAVSYIEDLLFKSETPTLIIAGRKVKYSGSFSASGG